LKKDLPGNKIILCLIALMLLAGCGLKGNPVPAASGMNRVQEEDQTLSASVHDGGVDLTWASPAGNYSHVKIERSELGTTGDICRDCPRTFKGIADLTVKHENRFADRSVERGKSYSYRLNWCDETGTCRLSRTVQVDLK